MSPVTLLDSLPAVGSQVALWQPILAASLLLAGLVALVLARRNR